ncbi:MAG: hypothetical protein ACRD3W_11230, partial [Terriglobales bacterium]
MKIRNLILWGWAVLVVVLATGILAALFWHERADWPQFPQPDAAHASAPQVVLKVERDYGWRTGDVVPVDLYIKQNPGTLVDKSSLAIVGDFEVRTQPKALIELDRPDGSHWIHLHFDVQSFTVAKSWTLNANMTFRTLKTGEDTTVTLPGTVLYTSATFDGRQDNLQQGPQKFITSVLDVLLVFGAFLIGVAAVIWGGRELERMAKGELKTTKERKTPLLVVHHNFALVWQRIRKGDYSARNYEELERNLRWLYKIEARTYEQADLELEMTNHPYYEEVTTVLRLCDKRLYQHQYLSDEEHEQIHSAFMRIFTAKPSKVPKPK